MTFKSHNVIVALTSWKPRLPYVHISINSILDCDETPDKVVLTVFKDDISYISKECNDLIQSGKVELIICDKDLKGAKRWYYLYPKYENDVVILIDDDILYPKNTISELISYYKKYPETVIVRNGRPILLDSPGEIKPFLDTKDIYRFRDIDINKPSYLNHFLCGCGTLIPPHAININEVDINLVEKYTQIDEVVLMYYLLKNNYKSIVIPHKSWSDIIQPIRGYDLEKYALWNKNKLCNTEEMHNDIGYNDLIYPELQRLYNDIWEINETLLTICIPIYNTDLNKFKKCINSLLNQTLKNFNIILIDDGSTNIELLEYINTLSKYENITVLYSEHIGVSNVRNIALNNIKTKYVSFFDSDDYYLSNNILLQIQQHLIYSNPDILLGARAKFSYPLPKNIILITNDINKKCVIASNNVSPQSKFYKVDFLIRNKIKYKPYTCAGDRLFYFTALKYAKRVCATNLKIFYYEKGEISSTHSFEKARDIILSELELENEYKNYILYNTVVGNNIKSIIKRFYSSNLDIPKKKELLKIIKKSKFLYIKFISTIKKNKKRLF